MPTASFNWDQAAAQLTRSTGAWQPALGTALTLTYAYRATANEPPPPPPLTAPWIGGVPPGTTGFIQFSPSQIGVMEIALDLIESVANITFNRVGTGTSDPGAFSDSADLLFGNVGSGPAGGWGYYAYWYFNDGIPPDPFYIRAGKAFFNNSITTLADPTVTNSGIRIYLHEVLHTITLAHPGNYDSLNGTPITYASNAEYIQDSYQYTVMSYFDEQETGANYGAYQPMTPMLHDIAALQRLFGANMTTRTGDSIYGFNSNTGVAAFTFSSASDARVFTIWDAGGIDTLDLSGFTTTSLIDIRAESFSSGGLASPGTPMVYNIAIARGVVIENAIGGSGSDTLIGNGAANEFTGNGGADTIEGGAGVDTSIYGVASGSASFVRNGLGWNVTAQGVDTLTGVEYLRFSDRT
ncbi:MAG: M10 family metallopeptidase C-terminal domain-containing protein, partial [Hyphomonadaceae bacterium]